MTARIFNRNYELIVTGLILVIGFLLYSHTFYSPFYFDDTRYIINNPAIRNILDPATIWHFSATRFIVLLSFALNYHLHQLNVLGYHLTNLLIHVSAAFLVWKLVLLIFATPELKKSKLSDHSKIISLFTALIFLSHPLQTESVTYIWQRCTCLAGFFYLACVCLYLKSRLARLNNEPWLKPYVFSILLALLCLFTKENTVTLPATLMLCEFCFLKSHNRHDFKYTIPFWLLLPVIPVLLYLTRSYSLNSGWRYLLTQAKVMITYIRLAVIPLHQNLDYDYPLSKSVMDFSVWRSFALLAGIMFFAARIFSKYRVLTFGIAWFFLTLLPDSSFVPLEDVIFEHRLYLPLVGFSLFLVSLVVYFLGQKSFNVMVAVLLAVTLSYAMLTYKRNFTWQDEITLWNDVVAKSPHKARPYYNRGVVYWEQGQVEQAIADFSKAIELNPRNYAMAYYNRGVAFDEQGKDQAALLDYSKAIQANPKLAEPYNNRGNVFKRLGNLTQAFDDFNKAIEVNPRLVEAYVSRGALYAQEGKFTQAIGDFSLAIEINPGYVIAYTNRGNVYAHQGAFAQAIADFTKGIAVDPEYAGNYIHRGHVYFKAREYDKSWADVHKAQALGYIEKPEFLAALAQASGINK